jgi:uncharacterized membrane protein
VSRSKGSDRGQRFAGALAVSLAVVTVAGILLLRPTGDGRPDAAALVSFDSVVRARVAAVEDAPCPGVDDGTLVCRRISFRLLEGPDEGDTFELELIADTPRTASLGPGDAVLMGHVPGAPKDIRYAYLDPDRRSSLAVLLFLFALSVIVLGGFRGVTALVGLAATVGVLLWFIIPSILEGQAPLLVALVGSSAIAFLALYLSHGFSTMTTVALLGTLAGLLSVVFMELAEITGFGSEEAFIVQALGGSIDLRGVVLGGIVIGALGAIDDMTITQASAVWELRSADPAMTPRRLLRSGLRIGRDHVASTVNTLVLAYAGASMPLLILFVLSRQSFGVVANGEIVATEIVRTLVGSIGLVISVPITTWLAVRVAGRARGPSGPEDEPPDDPRAPDELELPQRRRDALF